MAAGPRRSSAEHRAVKPSQCCEPWGAGWVWEWRSKEGEGCVTPCPEGLHVTPEGLEVGLVCAEKAAKGQWDQSLERGRMEVGLCQEL